MEPDRIRKPATAISAFLMISGLSTAFSFGSVAYDTEKAVENPEFEIGLINLNDEALDVNLTTQGLSTEEFNKQYVLQPSETSRNPRGEGWVSIGGGAYAKPRNIDFSADFERSRNFTVRLEASKIFQDDQNEIQGQAIQVREHFYKVQLPTEQRPEVDRGFEKDDESEEKDPELVHPPENSNQQSKIGSDYDQQNRQEKRLNSSQNIITDKGSKSGNENRTKSSNNPDATTVILGLGALGSIAYLWAVL